MRPFVELKINLVNLNRLRQLECQRALCRQNDFLISGISCACCAGACTCDRTNRCSFAASRQCADQSACSSATADEASRPFTFALGNAFHGRGLHCMGSALDGDGIQANLKQGPAFEMAHTLCINHLAVCFSACGDYTLAADRYRLGNAGGESLAGKAVFRTERFTQTHMHHGPRWDGNDLSHWFSSFGIVFRVCGAAASGRTISGGSGRIRLRASNGERQSKQARQTNNS